MPFTVKDAKDLCDAVAYWIGFRTLLGRQDHLSERNLSEPISDYLISRSRPWTLSSEFNHPTIRQPQRGRPKQFDFVLQQNQSIRVCIETKFGTCNPVDLINDLLRLALLPGGQIYRLFLHVLPDDQFATLHGMRMQNGVIPIRKLTGFLEDGARTRVNFNSIAESFDQNASRYDKWVAKILADFNDENPLVDGAQFPGGITSTMIKKMSVSGHTTYVLRVGRLQRVRPLNFGLFAREGLRDEDA